MSKFNTCIYGEYFGDYGMSLCNHPSRANDRTIYDSDCRKCNVHQTATGGIARCPFCGCVARISTTSKVGANWKVKCDGCGANISRLSSNAAIIAWNHRVKGGGK